MVGKEDTCTEV